MNQSIIYALDFDGVICDSAIETGISAWKAASQIWDDFSPALPTAEQSAQFRRVRPYMGTGYEGILVVRLLNNGDSADEVISGYHDKIQQVMVDSGLTIDDLKRIFGETRDQWIKQDLDNWVEMNPLFPGVIKKLKRLSELGEWYIITTKQERFVKQILQANQIELPGERVFGLDRNVSKEAVLVDLVTKHTGQTICFIEDMLPTLRRIINNPQLKAVKLDFAMWGYNTEQDKVDAEALSIRLIESPFHWASVD